MGRVIARPPLPPGPYLVVGLARSGVAAALALRELGESVVGTDARPVAAEVKARLEAAGVSGRDGESGAALVESARSVVKSPGVPQEAPVVAAARSRGLHVIGEVELGWRLLGNEFLALTGSNGKTTTVELIGHVHREAGLPVVVAGNVGTALVSLRHTLPREALVVCEVSSFQLEDTVAFAPETAGLLNLAEDHLDRHGTLKNYPAARLRISAQQPRGPVGVARAELPRADAGGAATRVTFATAPPAAPAGVSPPDLAFTDGELRWRGE